MSKTRKKKRYHVHIPDLFPHSVYASDDPIGEVWDFLKNDVNTRIGMTVMYPKAFGHNVYIVTKEKDAAYALRAEIRIRFGRQAHVKEKFRRKVKTPKGKWEWRNI